MLIPSRPIARRHLLRGTGAAIALPFLEAMGASVGRRVIASDVVDAGPKRLVIMCAGLGFHAPHLFSKPARGFVAVDALPEAAS